MAVQEPAMAWRVRQHALPQRGAVRCPKPGILLRCQLAAVFCPTLLRGAPLTLLVVRPGKAYLGPAQTLSIGTSRQLGHHIQLTVHKIKALVACQSRPGSQESGSRQITAVSGLVQGRESQNHAGTVESWWLSPMQAFLLTAINTDLQSTRAPSGVHAALKPTSAARH